MDFTVWWREDGRHGQRNATLTVDGDTIVCTAKDGAVDMSRVLMIGKKRIGAYGQQWPALQYADGEGRPVNAYFGDRRLLGWKGMLGGNDAIGGALRAARPDAPQAPIGGMPLAGAVPPPGAGAPPPSPDAPASPDAPPPPGP